LGVSGNTGRFKFNNRDISDPPGPKPTTYRPHIASKRGVERLLPRHLDFAIQRRKGFRSSAFD
jgi:hypothetical protein